MVGAVECEVPQRGELRFYPVQPGRIRRGVGDLGVVRRRPPSDALVFAGGQVRAEVVADDRDPDIGRVEGAQVAAESQEPGPVLARLDVPLELVFAQVAGGEQVPNPGGAGIGGAQPAARRLSRLFALAADRRALPAGPGLEAKPPELVHADHHLRIARLWATLRSAMAYRCSTRAFFAW